MVHEALGYGACHLSIAVCMSLLCEFYKGIYFYFYGLTSESQTAQIPKYGIFENIDSLDELSKMPQWTKDRPLRIETGFSYVRWLPIFFLIASLVLHN